MSSRRWQRRTKPSSTTSSWRCAAARCAATLARHGGIPKKPLIAAMPISLREPGNTEFTTQATMSMVNLNTHVADPPEAPARDPRRGRCGEGAGQARQGCAADRLPLDRRALAVARASRRCTDVRASPARIRRSPTWWISNVPGPQLPLYVAGARMATYWPMSIVEHGLGLNITVMAMPGRWAFGFTTARSAVPGRARAVGGASGGARRARPPRADPHPARGPCDVRPASRIPA